MKMKLGLALIWTIVLIADIVSACLGYEPNWMLVFCPVIALVYNCWVDYSITRLKNLF